MAAVSSLLPQGAEASTYEGNTWIVDAAGNGDFTSIQAAIAASSPGDMIRVNDGSYAENLFIDKRLAIIGNGTDTTTVDGQGLGDVITVSSDDVTIRGLNITGSPNHSGIIVNGQTGTVIEDNGIHSNRYGINVQSAAGMRIANNTVALNDWNGVLLGSLQDSVIRDNTIILHATSSLTLMLQSTGNLVENNTISDGGIGISIQDSSTMNTLRANHIQYASMDAIRLTNSFGNQVENNTLEQNQLGLLLINSDDNMMVNNTIKENLNGVQFFDSHDNAFIRNDVSDNGPVGIELENSDRNIFSKNTVKDHGDRGLQAVGSMNLTLVGNIVSGQDVGVYVSGGPGLILQDNEVAAVEHALRVISSPSASIVGNKISGAEYGIGLSTSDSAVIWNNNMTGTDHAISLTLSMDADVRFNEADSNEAGLRVDNSDSALAMDNEFRGGFYGVRIGFSEDARIMHNTLTDNNVGILIQDFSSGNMLAYNHVSGAGQYGIAISNSHNNTVKGNDLTSSFIGVQVFMSSDDVLLYNNNFLFNDVHANDEGANRWNETAANGGGNHWQDFSANPGFPDEYQVPGGANVDFLPLTTLYDNIRPTADAGGDRAVGQNEAVLLSAGASTDNVGITEHIWEFNDGMVVVTSSLPALVHKFPLVGEYSITLTVRDASGLEDSDTVIVTVLDTEDPVAVAGPDVSIEMGDNVVLNASGSGDNVGVSSYLWTFNDGVADLSYNNPVAEHTFTRAGVFTVTLTVGDAAGNNGTDTTTVTVNLTLSIGPVLSANGPLEGAEVAVLHAQTWYNATTDADGMAALSLPPSAAGSSLGVFVSMAGHDDVAFVTVASAEGALTDPVPAMAVPDEPVNAALFVVIGAAVVFVMAYMLGRFRG